MINFFNILIFITTLLYSVSIDDLLSYNNQVVSADNNETEDLSSLKEDMEELIFLDETIDPDSYRLGPGDNLSFNLISSDGSILLTLTVSPIGNILIPNIGKMKVR